MKEKFIALSLLIISIYFISGAPAIDPRVYAGFSEEDVFVLPKEISDKLSDSTSSANLRIPILMYHYVEYVSDPGDSIRKSLNIVPFVFQNQIKTLVEAGYNFITPSELAEMIDGRAEIPPRPIVLSFDDGYQDFYQNVFPVLKKYNIKSVNYVIAGFIDKPNFMYSWQVREIATSGAVEIGSHTVNHIALRGEKRAKAEFEIFKSKEILEKLIGQPVISFAYPSGSFDLQAEELVKKAGYKTAVSTVPGIMATDQNKFFLYRIRPGERMGNSLLEYLSQNAFKAY